MYNVSSTKWKSSITWTNEHLNNEEELLLHCTSQMWKPWRLYWRNSTTLYLGTLYYYLSDELSAHVSNSKWKSSITWINEDLTQSTKKNYCYIVHPKCRSHEDFLLIQIADGAVYFKATESITWTYEDLNQQRRIIVILYMYNSQMWKSWRVFMSQTTDGAVYLKATERKFYRETIIQLWKSKDKTILERQWYSVDLESGFSYENCLLHLSLVMFQQLINTKVL